MPDPWFQYLVVASPWIKAGSGSASILSLTAARAKGIAQGPAHTVIAKEGGEEAALTVAEDFLDKEHPGLKKLVSDPKSR
jgi:hypothetical protein